MLLQSVAVNTKAYNIYGQIAHWDWLKLKFISTYIINSYFCSRKPHENPSSVRDSRKKLKKL